MSYDSNENASSNVQIVTQIVTRVLINGST